MSGMATYSVGSPMHRWVTFVRIAQAVLAVIVLGLSAYAAHTLFGGYESYGFQQFPGYPFVFFSFSWTVVYLIFTFAVAGRLAEKFRPLFIVATLEFLTVLWWLVAFALMAKASSDFTSPAASLKTRKHKRDYGDYNDPYSSSSSGSNYDSNGDSSDTSDSGVGILSSISAAVASTKAAAGLGALEFILFAVTFGAVVMAIVRDNKREEREMANGNNNNMIGINKEEATVNVTSLHGDHRA